MLDMSFKYNELLTSLKEAAPFKPGTALILGSGLGKLADKLETIKSIKTSSLPNYPKSTVEGHEGYIHFTQYKGKHLLLFQGRIHFYEGYKLYECVLPVHIAKELGAENLILTNAAGGINPNFKPGDLMLANSFNSLNIKKELTGFIGLANISQKNRTIDFTSGKINEIVRTAALEEKIMLKEGVYILTKGPSYETPAEVKMYSKLGIDAVGMSTVHEAIYAAINGMNVASISLITNYAAGISPVKLSHQEVIDTAEKSKDKFERLIKRTIELL